MSSQQRQQPECCICLQAAAPRGGSPLVTPGCCGAWYHQSCMQTLLVTNRNECPACRAPFAPGIEQQVPTPAPAPNRSIFGAIASVFGFGGRQPQSQTLQQPPTQIHQQPQFQQQQQQQFQAPSRQRRNQSFFQSSSREDSGEDSGGSEIPVEEPVDPIDITPQDAGPSLDDPAYVELSVNSTPELQEIGISAKSSFYTSVGMKFNACAALESAKVPLDLVCILDTSGSMIFEKLQSLKKAMEFVVRTLGPKDRLSIVSFNSYSQCMHGLIKMTAANKSRSESILNGLDSGGGTDILSGMQKGWSVLEKRSTRNPSSCVFLLTDGQDADALAEKRQLAQQMKGSGTSLFVFGFGADHDSQHMNAIAEAAEGSFTYIERDDTVVDAFGGAIGIQQGKSLRNITLEIRATSAGVRIKNALAGAYSVTTDSERTSCRVSFLNLYMGEVRDVLVELELPGIGDATEAYPVLEAKASYTSVDGGSSIARETEPVICSIRRLSDKKVDPSIARNVAVDVQVNRVLATKATRDAMDAADNGEFKQASAIINAAIAALKISPSYLAGDRLVTAFLQDLEEALTQVTDRTSYASGGRAQLTEQSEEYSHQRSCYTKSHKVAKYQSMMSSSAQSSAMATKKR